MLLVPQLVTLAHAALKWLHFFVSTLDRNPLDSEFCRISSNLLNAKSHSQL